MKKRLVDENSGKKYDFGLVECSEEKSPLDF